MNIVAKQFTLGKNERLKSRKSIEELFRAGKTLSASPFRVYYQVSSVPNERSTTGSADRITNRVQFGVGVSSRNFKKAVDRNRIKRLVRESYRLQKQPLSEKIRSKNLQLNIFFIYSAKEVPAYTEVFKRLGSALGKLDQVIEKL